MQTILNRCGAIINTSGVFGQCIAKVTMFDAQLFYASCVYDACLFNVSTICLSLEVFALECSNLGSPVAGWRNATGCRECRRFRRLALARTINARPILWPGWNDWTVMIMIIVVYRVNTSC